VTRIPVERLIDGVVQTLVDAVLPAIDAPFARGQLYAAVDVLRNLRDRVEPRADLAAAESDSAAAALAEAIASLRDAHATASPRDAHATASLGDAAAAAAAIAAALARAPAAPPLARVAALRAGLVGALDAVAGLPEPVAGHARAPIMRHLGAQAMRDVAVLKPSMLGEISRG
jgi:hypothetical protein